MQIHVSNLQKAHRSDNTALKDPSGQHLTIMQLLAGEDGNQKASFGDPIESSIHFVMQC